MKTFQNTKTDWSRPLARIQKTSLTFWRELAFMMAVCAVAIVVSGGLARAQQPVITSFASNGQLTWTNLPGTNAFTVEWASTATGTWSRSWQTLDSVVSTGRQTTVRVPMFYRVAQGFSSASLRGPWLLTLTPTNVSYLWFDGAGTITEAATFFPGIPCGYYSVQATGTVASTFLSTHDGPRSAQGRFVSGQKIVFDPPYSTLQMSQ